MADPIDFYFDFSSPYGYFAAEKIDALAAQHGRGVNWRPILLGAVFKVNGQQPLANIPLKGDYAAHDALDRMLTGTGLSATKLTSTSSSVTVSGRPATVELPAWATYQFGESSAED